MLLWGGLGGLRRTAAPGEEQAWDGDGHEHSKIPLEMGGCGRRPLHTIPMTARPGCVHGVVRRAHKITALNIRAGPPPPDAPLTVRFPRHARLVSARSERSKFRWKWADVGAAHCTLSP